MEKKVDEKSKNKTRNKNRKKIIIITIITILILISIKISSLLSISNSDYEKYTYDFDISDYPDEYKNKEYLIINNYMEYQKVKSDFSKKSSVNKFNISKIDFALFLNHNILVVICDGNTSLTSNIGEISINDNTANVEIYADTHGITASAVADLYFIPVSKNITNANINYNYKDYTKNYPMTDDKPIIYLYPEKEENITVKLGYKDNITCSYPRYIDRWSVIAKPNGDIIDTDTNKELYSLYYESRNTVDFKVENTGFVIKGEDTADFLDSKLEILGLNAKEKEEFIIYWLPKLEANKYNYIRFASQEEINKNMPLEFSTKPDSLIRVLMTYKGLDEPINVKEQKLDTPQRQGFIAVEWGGTEIN